ncbi:hypothetical protein ACHAXH_008622 [Discostella pseudostelligera]
MAVAAMTLISLMTTSSLALSPCYQLNPIILGVLSSSSHVRRKRVETFTSSTLHLAKMRKFNYPVMPSPSPSPSSSIFSIASFTTSSTTPTNSNLSSSHHHHHHVHIVKILKRNVYPTVILPIDDNEFDIINGNTHPINDDATKRTTISTTTSTHDIDHYFMGLALQQARHAWRKGEVPIGAIIVTERTYQILAMGHNLVETTMDASAHAELVALRQGAKTRRNWRYPPSTTLYSTLEPCPICLSSIQAFRIDHIVYGALDHRLGAISSHMELLKVAKHPYHEVKSTRGGVREAECGEIVKQFFRERRRMNKEQKRSDRDVEADKDEAQQQLLKLSRQTRRPPRKNDIKKKEPFVKQHTRIERGGDERGDGKEQQPLLKVSRRKRNPLWNYIKRMVYS